MTPRYITGLAFLSLAIASQAGTPASKTDRLVRQISRKCNLRAGILSAVNGEVRLAPTPTDKYEKVDCALAALKKANAPLMGFVGNEIDPNEVLKTPYRYIAEGTENQITLLAEAVTAEGWVIAERARANDGTSFLTFQTRPGETVGASEKLTKRIWNNEFGNLGFGRAPSKLSDRSDEQ